MSRWLISKFKYSGGDAGQIDDASPFSIDQSALADLCGFCARSTKKTPQRVLKKYRQ